MKRLVSGRSIRLCTEAIFQLDFYLGVNRSDPGERRRHDSIVAPSIRGCTEPALHRPAIVLCDGATFQRTIDTRTPVYGPVKGQILTFAHLATALLNGGHKNYPSLPQTADVRTSAFCTFSIHRFQCILVGVLL